MYLQSSGPLLFRVAPCRLDLDQLWTGSKLWSMWAETLVWKEAASRHC